MIKNIDQLALEFVTQAHYSAGVNYWLEQKGARLHTGAVDPNTEYAERVREIVKNTVFTPATLDYALIPGLGNLARPHQDRLKQDLPTMLDSIRKEDARTNRTRNYDLDELVNAVQQARAEPPTLMIQPGNLVIVDGRTRLSIAYALKTNIPIITFPLYP